MALWVRNTLECWEQRFISHSGGSLEIKTTEINVDSGVPARFPTGTVMGLFTFHLMLWPDNLSEGEFNDDGQFNWQRKFQGRLIFSLVLEKQL